jgi:cbb3-type cytochrome oxidase subunit 1
MKRRHVKEGIIKTLIWMVVAILIGVLLGIILTYITLFIEIVIFSKIHLPTKSVLLLPKSILFFLALYSFSISFYISKWGTGRTMLSILSGVFSVVVALPLGILLLFALSGGMFGPH